MYYLRIVLFIAALFSTSLLAATDPLDINSASQQQLAEQMVGIGPSKALAIVEYRGTHGPFQTIDDLAQVKGISSSTIERNRDRITARPVKTKP